MSTATILIPIAQLEKDIQRASVTLGRDEARFLVDTYYSIQRFRIQSTNQVRAILKSEKEEPHSTLRFFSDQFALMEKQIQSTLDTYSASDPWGEWLRLHTGVGPVIAAGLMAHVDISKARYAASIWRFAGLLPGQKKVKGVKRDWNADLKVLAWKLGDSFIKQSGRDTCYYGHIYLRRRALEIERDKNDYNKEEAAKILQEKNIRDKATREIYESGHLPDGQILARARRYAVKRFLAHSFEQLWWFTYGTQPPDPYVQSHLNHQEIEKNPYVPYIKKKVYW